MMWITLDTGYIGRFGKQNECFTKINYMYICKTYMYSLIFFNVQGGACQFLIDNDKVDHYI